MMRTTLSIAYGRVASGGDYIALGEGRVKTPGWLHLAVDFRVVSERHIVFQRILAWKHGDENEVTFTLQELGPQIAQAVERHCHAFDQAMQRAFPDRRN